MGRLRPLDSSMRSFSFLLGFVALIFSLEPSAHPGADAAIKHFTEQIITQPENQLLYLQRGTVYSNDGKYPEALADFQRAARLGDSVLASFDLGVLYYRQGDFDIARLYFDEYLQRFPDNASCLEYRARLLRDTGEYAAAVADYRKLFQLQEQPNPGNFIAVAEILASGEGKDIDQALEILDIGNAKLGVTPQLQNYAIELELQLNRHEQALARMHALESVMGASPDWKVDMGELMLRSGKRAQAEAMLDTAALQLSTLRTTPARLETLKRIATLRSELDAPDSAAVN